MGAIRLNVQLFIKQNRSDWNQLEQILPLFAKSPKKIHASQIDELSQLYKKTSAHLAHMRTYHPEDDVTEYLNHLVAQAHHAVFQEQFKSKHQLGFFFKVYFPSLIRSRQRFILFAFLLFLIGALSGFIAIWQDSANVYAVLPQSIAGNIDPSQTGKGLETAPHAVMSASIMTNNIKVAIFAFVGGITFGIATVYFMLYNGLIVGALAAVYWKAGQSYLFWAYILPHGIIELTAIFIAGGAGLYMGYRMFVPGPYPWKLQLVRSAKETVQLLMGTIPLFVIAGTIEGYITPSSLSLSTKYSFAIGTLLLLAAYYAYGWMNRNQSASLDLISK
jgi:uncharacterized membrane protein SpoIIM required for sporulation